ncbi:MAG: helix-turn-helix domain-containing protein [Pseudonocardia sp.]
MITALFVECQSPAEVAARYGVHRSWVYRLKARYEAEGEAALAPRSRRPNSSPQATAPETVELVLLLRKQLAEQGLDAGADTIGWHLTHHHQITVSRATIHRILARHGAVAPEPAKRPRSSYIRFVAEQPNECWQSDFTHYRLTRPDERPGPPARKPTPPTAPAPPTTTTASAPTRSTKPGVSPSASPATSATSASADPTPEPTSRS